MKIIFFALSVIAVLLLILYVIAKRKRFWDLLMHQVNSLSPMSDGLLDERYQQTKKKIKKLIFHRKVIWRIELLSYIGLLVLVYEIRFYELGNNLPDGLFNDIRNILSSPMISLGIFLSLIVLLFIRLWIFALSGSFKEIYDELDNKHKEIRKVYEDISS